MKCDSLWFDHQYWKKLFYTEDESNTPFRNACVCLPNYKASRSRLLFSSFEADYFSSYLAAYCAEWRNKWLFERFPDLTQCGVPIATYTPADMNIRT